MIKEDKVLVKVNVYNQKKYKKLGYNFDLIKKGEYINILVDIKHLTKGSHIKVTAICENCENEKKISYSKYLRNYNRNNKGYYSCFDCKSIVLKQTCLNKFGVDSYSKTDEFKKFISENLNYEEIHKKCKETNLERYGHEYYFQTKSVREGNKKWMSSDDFKEKSKETLIKKYGVDSYSKTDEFKKGITDNKKEIVNKIKSTFRDKYGVDWISQSKIWKEKYNLKYEIIRDKVRNTCISIYGVDSVSKVKEIMSRIMETKVKNGVVISNEQLSDWEVYKKSSQREINKIKNQLYEKWDGKDFYDGEYIKDNFRYGHTNRLYPTIDHKISVHYGFSNNIPVEEISDISNLCITKRYINCSKNKLNYYEFTI